MAFLGLLRHNVNGIVGAYVALTTAATLVAADEAKKKQAETTTQERRKSHVGVRWSSEGLFPMGKEGKSSGSTDTLASNSSSTQSDLVDELIKDAARPKLRKTS